MRCRLCPVHNPILRPLPDYATQEKFETTVRSAVYFNVSTKPSFSKTIFKPEESINASFKF